MVKLIVILVKRWPVFWYPWQWIKMLSFWIWRSSKHISRVNLVSYFVNKVAMVMFCRQPGKHWLPCSIVQKTNLLVVRQNETFSEYSPCCFCLKDTRFSRFRSLRAAATDNLVISSWSTHCDNCTIPSSSCYAANISFQRKRKNFLLEWH